MVIVNNVYAIRMEIPKRFKLLAHTVEVVDDTKYCEASGILGEAHLDINKITLSTTSNKETLPQSVKEHTFIHEVIHCILRQMGENELNKNEKFVDMFAGLLHQVLTTQEHGE